jgi:hypothetical protein
MEKLIERTSGSSSSAVTEIVTALQPLLAKFIEKGDLSRAEQIEARREERERERQAEDKRRDDERVRREEDREARKEEAERRREEDNKRRAEEQKADDKRREEERRREDDRREAAREEREKLREEKEADRERQKEEREREREQAKAAADERQRQHDRDLLAANERAKQDQHRQQEFMTMMQNFQNSQLQMLEARMETGGLKGLAEQMIMLKRLSGTLSGEDREQSTVDRIADGAERIIEVITPAAKQFLAGRGGAAAPTQAAPQQTRVLAVDLGPKRQVLPNPVEPATPAPAQATPAPAASDEPPASTTQVPDEVNDFTDFHFPEVDEDFKVTASKLVKSVDLAIQKNMSADDIVEKILMPFEKAAPFIMHTAAKWEEDELMTFIEEHVPASWAILTPQGEEVVLDAFEAFQERLDKGGA